MESLSGNYISQLNEYQQKTQCTVEYEEGSTDGPSHNKTFTMRAVVNGQRYSEGTGKTKKEAKQNAAKNALKCIKTTQNIEPTTSSVQNPPNNTTVSQRNYICWLNEYSQKSKLFFKPHESTKMDPGSTHTFNLKYLKCYVCGDREFPEAYGKNKKDAKEAAATRVYEELNKTHNALNSSLKNEFVFADESRSATPDSNYIALLNNYCQKHNRVFDFKLVEKRGPPHNPEFVYKVVMKGKEYPEGQGKSTKEAKQHAAQRAWSEINEQSGWTTQAGLYLFHSKSQDAQHSSKSSSETPSSSSSIVFKDSSAVTSPVVISPIVSPLDVKPKIKLAPNFNLSPNGLARSKEVGPNMNAQNPAKPSGGQTSNQATKSRFLEDFDSINPIGKGGFGRVFKARRVLENTYFAVKIVKSTEKARREVGALAKFNNANIVRYYTSWVEDTAYRHESSESYSLSDSGSDPGTKFLYIQMEFCEGDTLRAWIDERNSSDVRDAERRTEAAQINRQVLVAVKYIHSKGLIHRDLKPLNIMFSSEGRVKVGDFGLVTAAENNNDEHLLERTKRTGTRIYMSPEQATQTSYDRKVDIYALGLIYFELLWNLVRDERKKIWDDIRSRDFPLQFSKKYSFEHKLIDRMLSPSPEERPDASELIRLMDGYTNILNADKDNRTI
uniref:non-specific serine/threonine protein kinase n=1 Tax=Cyprinus carpio TaxID=7962 RepID=A0A8C2J9D6_CYPCA